MTSRRRSSHRRTSRRRTSPRAVAAHTVSHRPTRRYRGESALDNTLDTTLETLTSISEQVDFTYTANSKLVPLRKKFRSALTESLQSVPHLTEWFKNVEPDALSRGINEMLFTTLGVGKSTPPRDPETTQLIIDTLCEASVPFTLQLLSRRLSDRIPKDFLPPPSETLRREFTRFWDSLELKFMEDYQTNKIDCLTTNLHMAYAVSMEHALGGSAWKDFLRTTLPADRVVTLSNDVRLTMSWTAAFDKHRSKEENIREMKRLAEGTKQILALTKKVTGE